MSLKLFTFAMTAAVLGASFVVIYLLSLVESRASRVFAIVLSLFITIVNVLLAGTYNIIVVVVRALTLF